MHKILILIPLIMVLAACNSPNSGLVPSAEKAVEGITCENSQSRLYDVLYTGLVQLEEIPTEEQLREVFEEALDKHPDLRFEKAKFLQLVSEFYQILLKVPAKDSKELLEKLTAIEVGDQTTAEAQSVQADLNAFQSKWETYTSVQDVECPGIVSPAPQGKESGIVYGGRKVLVTAYQSCEANRKPAMTIETPDVQGIEIVGTHSDGVGSKRKITDLKLLQKTDYYLQNWTASNSCKDVRSNPPIYDYGGKPYTTADDNSTLNLFKNAGSGTSVLGIDCSGYLFSAIAAGGLKLHPTKKLKAISVHGINARMYMDPVNNGMPCFEKVKMGVSGTLKAGDVAAISGHIILVDSVSSDPLGISKAKTASECANLNYKNFKFVILQSSPSKNGIGINRINAVDYLVESSTIRNGFEKYARDACKAKFAKKDQLMTATNFQIIRHKMTAECMDKPIQLDGEACANSCSSLALSTDLNAVPVETQN